MERGSLATLVEIAGLSLPVAVVAILIAAWFVRGTFPYHKANRWQILLAFAVSWTVAVVLESLIFQRSTVFGETSMLRLFTVALVAAAAATYALPRMKSRD